MNRNLIRRVLDRCRWKDDPDAGSGGAGGSPAPDAGGDEASASPEPDAGGASGAEADPYLSDSRLPASMRKAEPKPEPALEPESKPTPEPAPEPKPEPHADPDDDLGDPQDAAYSDRVRKRIAKERAKRGELERANAELLARLDALEGRRPREAAAPDAPPVTEDGPLPPNQLLRFDVRGAPQEPKEEDFVDDETGLVDTIRLSRAWARYEIEGERFLEKQRAGATRHQAELADTWDRAEEQFRGATPDYDEAIEPLVGRLSAGGAAEKHFRAALTERGNPALVYACAKNEELTGRLLSLKPRALAAALDHLEGRLAAEGFEASPARPAAPTKPAPTPPPIPPRLPRGGGGSEEAFTRESVRGKKWDPLESTCRHASLSIL